MEQLAALYHHIADAASADIANKYVGSTISYCESLHTFPIRGGLREDARSGLRITNYRKRTVVAFEADEQATQVAILGLFYGGQDYEASFHDVPETGESF